MQVIMGNTHAKDAVYDHVNGEVLQRSLPGERVSTLHIPEGYAVTEAFDAVAKPDGFWANHTMPLEDGSAPAPDWAWSDSPVLQILLTEHFGCPSVIPEAWGAGCDAEPTVVGPAPLEPITAEPIDASATAGAPQEV